MPGSATIGARRGGGEVRDWRRTVKLKGRNYGINRKRYHNTAIWRGCRLICRSLAVTPQ